MNYIKKPPTSTVGKLCTFNTFGKGSAIKNISIEASIPSNFSTMVTIGSQANGSQAAGNATSFSNYNKGLVDSSCFRISVMVYFYLPSRPLVEGISERLRESNSIADRRARANALKQDSTI